MPTLPALTTELLFAAAAAACGALVAAGLLALWRIRVRGAGAAVEALGRQIAALRHENGAQSATLVALAAHFDSLQRQLATDARFGANPPGGATTSAYELAIRLARGGATTDELVSACMMSRHEAELTQRLHGSQLRAATPRLSAAR